MSNPNLTQITPIIYDVLAVAVVKWMLRKDKSTEKMGEKLLMFGLYDWIYTNVIATNTMFPKFDEKVGDSQTKSESESFINKVGYITVFDWFFSQSREGFWNRVIDNGGGLLLSSAVQNWNVVSR